MADKLPIINIYESGTSDGYTDRGTGRYYRTEAEAKADSERAWGRVHVRAALVYAGQYYLLRQEKPITLLENFEIVEKQAALAKLTNREKELLGLI